MQSRTFTVPNISCGHCVRTIEREVGEVPGVTRVSADQGARRVTVEWDESGSWEAVRDLLTEINYPPAE
jgi:copper chaperone CopZ